MGGLPTNPATNTLSGWSYRVRGGPTCWSTPSSITATNVPTASASDWSWVTDTIVVRSSRWSRTSSIRASRR